MGVKARKAYQEYQLMKSVVFIALFEEFDKLFIAHMQGNQSILCILPKGVTWILLCNCFVLLFCLLLVLDLIVIHESNEEFCLNDFVLIDIRVAIYDGLIKTKSLLVLFKFTSAFALAYLSTSFDVFKMKYIIQDTILI